MGGPLMEASPHGDKASFGLRTRGREEMTDPITARANASRAVSEHQVYRAPRFMPDPTSQTAD